MTSIAEGIATNFAQVLIGGAIREVNYLCCFDTHVENFEEKKEILVAKRTKVLKDIEDAENRNENQVEDEVQKWLNKTDGAIQEDTGTKKKWFYGWCPNCIWQYRQGRKLAKKMVDIEDLIERCNFDKVARPTVYSSVKYYSPQNFIDFESRNSKFDELMEALKNENYYMIVLQGLGGTGKTTLAAQVAENVEESKAFKKVIFAVVSNPPDINKIRRHIARHLGLELAEGKEEEHSEALWSRIAEDKGRVLIILDDIWTKDLDLRDIGIPFGPKHKNCCVLITTRDSTVCEAMGCQLTIPLDILEEKDALNLFIKHVGSRSDDSSSKFIDLAQAIVKECGGLPLAIVAVATTLKGWQLRDWNNALKTLRNSKPLHSVHKDLIKVYSSLKLSYDNLEEQAKYLLRLCSLFPEDCEIPVDLLCKLGIGLGLFGEVDNYSEARRQVIHVKNELIKSSLLLEGEKVCVKMHDLIREVALWIAEKDVQVIMDSKTKIEPNLRFLFLRNNKFPNHLGGMKLEILILWLEGEVKGKDSLAIFKGMTNLRVLILCYDIYEVWFPLSLQSLLSLKNIPTLILSGWELGDISIMKDLQSLETLELTNCLIIELPEIKELKKLRLLGLRECKIERNNPFEVIGRCSQLEELYFVENEKVEEWKPKNDEENGDDIPYDVSPPEFQMYSIACSGLKYFDDDDNGHLRCFNTKHIKNLIPKAMFKYLVGRAEVLELGKIGETGWTSLVPDIVPMEDGGMNDLIRLCLYKWADIECLIDTNKLCNLDGSVFSNLIALHLDGVGVKKLYCGCMPSGFLEQLQILKLRNCKKLDNILFDGKFRLPHLKVLKLEDCPMFEPSIFDLSVARRLEQLEKLIIIGCKELKSLITDERPGDEIEDLDNQRGYGLLFPKLKSLQIKGCGKLELVLPLLLAGDLPHLEDLCIDNCKELKYIFSEYRDKGQVLHQEIMLPSLTEMELDGVPSFINIFKECKKCMQRSSPILKDDSKEKNATSRTRAFSWAHGCCFLPTAPDTDIVVSDATVQDHTTSQELSASMKWVQTSHTMECLLRQPLNLQNIRQMTLLGCSKLKSLFSVSIATTIMLEKLEIWRCEELKHIVTNEGEDHHHINCTSIFPKLQQLQILECNHLEFIFPSTFPGGLQKLKSIQVDRADELKYVFGRYHDEEYLSNENQNNEHHIHLPALETLSLENVPNMISICINKYHLEMECPSLQNLEAAKEVTASMKRVQISHAMECLLRQPLNLQNIREMTLKGCSKLKSLFSASIATTIMLEKLEIRDCKELKHIIRNEGEDHHHINCTSIFPKLQLLRVFQCNKLEFIFPSTFSGGLQKLKSIRVVGADKLKYVFGRYHDEEYLSNENQINEHHIRLPALETLSLQDVPNMISICINKCHLEVECPSLQNWEATKADDMHVQNVTSTEVAEESEIEEITNVERPMTSSVGIECVLNFHNLREIHIRGCKKLKALFSTSTWRSLPQLSELYIVDCEELVKVVEGDSKDHHHINYTSIFPKLERLEIQTCNKLEFIFPYSLSGVQKLKCLSIRKVAELKNVFGKYNHGDYLLNQNESDDLHIDLPALETLSLIEAPKMINICAKKCHLMRLPSLQEFALDNCQELDGRSFPNLTIHWKLAEELIKIIVHMQNLRTLELMNSRVEEVFNMEGGEIEGPVILNLESMVLKNLSELRHICRDSKYILSLQNLWKLQIRACKKLRVIFSASMLKSFPQLSNLTIEDCEELVHIIEEDYEKISTVDHLQQRCFPKLMYIHIKCCNRLKCLFSISSTSMFPKLGMLKIEEASELEQVFTSKQDETENMMMKDVFPTLVSLSLTRLPVLVSVCGGIDFQTLRYLKVVDCPKYEAIASKLQDRAENLDSENQALTEELQPADSNNGEAMPHIEEASGSPNLSEISPETMKKIIEGVPTSEISPMEPYPLAESQLRKPSLQESEDEQSTLEATLLSQQDLGETKILDLTKKESRSETITANQQLLGEKTATSVESIEEEATNMKAKIFTSSIDSDAKGSQSGLSAMPVNGQPSYLPNLIDQRELGEARDEITISRQMEVSSTKETVEQDFHENDASKEAIITIQSMRPESLKQSRVPLDNPPGNEFAKGTMEEGKEIVQNVLAPETSLVATSFESEFNRGRHTIKETRDADIQEGPKSEKTKMENLSAYSCDFKPDPMEDNTILSDVIPSLHCQSHIGAAGPSSPILEIAEIFQLVELKDGEAALLAKALELYPQLRLPREQRTNPIIAFSYRVLVDILVMLATNTPYTISASDKTALENNLGAATFFGFDKDWIELVRAKVFGVDKSDVLVAEEKISVMEAELETCDIKLEHIQKKRTEAKERLAIVQNEFEAVDSQLFGLLESRRKLVIKMVEFRRIISAKDRPFGI